MCELKRFNRKYSENYAIFGHFDNIKVFPFLYTHRYTCLVCSCRFRIEVNQRLNLPD